MMTVQGYSDDSSWARGQAWALYGFPMVYRFTEDEAYLNHAVSIAEYLLSRLPEDGVPYWDYDAPGIPDEVRDVSAAAIMASGLIELSTYSEVDVPLTFADYYFLEALIRFQSLITK